MARRGVAGLTEKQARFADEYLIDLNATQAAIRAGYSAKTAFVQASKLLNNPKVAAYVEQRKQDQQARTQITSDWVIRQLVQIATASGSDYITVDASGAIKYIPTDQLTPAQKAAIAGIKPTMAGPEIKTYDRLKALELIGRHLGTFDSSPKTSANDVEDLQPLADMLNDDDAESDGDDA